MALLLCCPLTLAQKGKAPPGYYPIGYAGDTWTGFVTAVNGSTREITLTTIHRGKVETFTGVLAERFTAQRGAAQAPGMALSSMVIGWKARVFYLRDRDTTELPTQSVFKAYLLPQGNRAERVNLVFLLDVMEDPGGDWTGTVTATDDATRQITLSRGGDTLTGELLPGYHVRLPDGRLHELKVSEIPSGTAITVRYVRERLKVDGKEIRTHVIYRIDPPKK